MSGKDTNLPITQQLVDAAERAGARHGRSSSEQLEHWVRLGRAVSQQSFPGRHRIDQALAGDLAPEDLNGLEIIIFNAEVEAGIEKKLSEVNYAELRAQRGLSSVALDSSGDLIEYRPDGTTRKIEGPGVGRAP